MVVRVFWGGREFMAVLDQNCIDPLLALCQALALGCGWDPETGMLFVDSPASGKTVWLSGIEETSDDELPTILSNLLSGAGARVVTGPVRGEPVDLALRFVPNHPDSVEVDLGFGVWDKEARRVARAVAEAAGLRELSLSVKPEGFLEIPRPYPSLTIRVAPSTAAARYGEAVFAGVMRYLGCLKKGECLI